MRARGAPDAPGSGAQVAAQGGQREQERQRCVLTLAELEPLPDNTNTYKGLGRACVPARRAGGARAARRGC